MDCSLNSHAKINLFLDVLSKLENGYHQILTIFSEINLCDQLKFFLTNKQEIKIVSNIESLNNSDNLIFKIAFYLQNRFSVKKGVIVELNKMIPVAAGLGGGSSNAACALKGLSHIWDLKLDRETRHEIASQFGSDINFFLEGGTAIGKNRGELLEKCNHIEIDNILLVNPNIPISSKTAYQAVKISLPNNSWNDLLKSSDPGFCYNKLEEGIIPLYPIIQELKNQMHSLNAINTIMSGSGSTVIGFFDDPQKCKNAQTWFENKGYWSYITTTRRRLEE